MRKSSVFKSKQLTANWLYFSNPPWKRYDWYNWSDFAPPRTLILKLVNSFYNILLNARVIIITETWWKNIKGYFVARNIIQNHVRHANTRALFYCTLLADRKPKPWRDGDWECVNWRNVNCCTQLLSDRAGHATILSRQCDHVFRAKSCF